MELGIDSFAAVAQDEAGAYGDAAQSMRELLERIEQGRSGWAGCLWHRRAPPARISGFRAPRDPGGGRRAHPEYPPHSAPSTVLSAADPVRVFQNYATLDLVSGGRAEMVVGRGSFSESFPLFGLDFADYDSLFVEKLELLLRIRDSEHVHWSGRHRPALTGQGIYPRPLQRPLPIWVGVGGTPASFARAGALGLPLMVAVIGGETHRFAPLVDLYRRAGEQAGHAPDQLKVGLHSLGYVAETTQQAVDEFFPGYAQTFTKVGRERGWSPRHACRLRGAAGRAGRLPGRQSRRGRRQNCAPQRGAGRPLPRDAADGCRPAAPRQVSARHRAARPRSRAAACVAAAGFSQHPTVGDAAASYAQSPIHRAHPRRLRDGNNILRNEDSIKPRSCSFRT